MTLNNAGEYLAFLIAFNQLLREPPPDMKRLEDTVLEANERRLESNDISERMTALGTQVLLALSENLSALLDAMTEEKSLAKKREILEYLMLINLGIETYRVETKTPSYEAEKITFDEVEKLEKEVKSILDRINEKLKEKEEETDE